MKKTNRQDGVFSHNLCTERIKKPARAKNVDSRLEEQGTP
jgi:hypothetical protein